MATPPPPLFGSATRMHLLTTATAASTTGILTAEPWLLLRPRRISRCPPSDASAVDPEEAFVASLSNCHLLVSDFVARAHQWVVDHYEDHASGVLGRNAQGQLAMTRVTLRPTVRFAGPRQPTRLRTRGIAPPGPCFVLPGQLRHDRGGVRA